MAAQSRIARVTLSTLTIGAVALAPVADADASPLGLKLRSVMTLQPDEGGEPAGDASAEGPGDVAAPAPEGPAPAPAAPAGPPPSKGLGMMISGAVITGAYALPLIGFGAYTIVVAKKADDVVGGMGIVQGAGALAGGIAVAFGMIGLAVGAPLLGVGAYRFSKYQKWKAGQTARFSPSAGRTAFGTITPGLVINF